VRGARPARALALGAALVTAMGCAGEAADQPLPAACGAGQEAVQAALETAPRPVRLEGVPLSRCFDPLSDGSELQSVGISFVGAASALAERARRGPESEAATRLGYLVGAMRRGAGRSNAQGIHTELVRRVEQELTLVDPRSRALREGIAAGERTG
jgi:hypothetical protein